MHKGNSMELNKNKTHKLRLKNGRGHEKLVGPSGGSIGTIQIVDKAGKYSLETVKALAYVSQVQLGVINTEKENQLKGKLEYFRSVNEVSKCLK